MTQTRKSQETWLWKKKKKKPVFFSFQIKWERAEDNSNPSRLSTTSTSEEALSTCSSVLCKYKKSYLLLFTINSPWSFLIDFPTKFHKLRPPKTNTLFCASHLAWHLLLTSNTSKSPSLPLPFKPGGSEWVEKEFSSLTKKLTIFNWGICSALTSQKRDGPWEMCFFVFFFIPIKLVRFSLWKWFKMTEVVLLMLLKTFGGE